MILWKLPSVQKSLELNVPINISILKELSDRLLIALGDSFPAFLANESVNVTAGIKRMKGCQPIIYIYTTAHLLTSNDEDLAHVSSVVTSRLKLKKNSLLTL